MADPSPPLTIRARVSEPLMRALETLARRTGQTRSELTRAALTRCLAQDGLWPPEASHGE